jgi:hypothetical protein
VPPATHGDGVRAGYPLQPTGMECAPSRFAQDECGESRWGTTSGINPPQTRVRGAKETQQPGRPKVRIHGAQACEHPQSFPGHRNHKAHWSRSPGPEMFVIVRQILRERKLTQANNPSSLCGKTGVTVSITLRLSTNQSSVWKHRSQNRGFLLACSTKRLPYPTGRLRHDHSRGNT